MTEETQTKNQIKQFLEANGWYVRTLQLGGVGGRRNLSKGMSDLQALKRGVFMAIEVKTKNGRVSTEQQQYIDCVNFHGGVGLIVRSFDEFYKIFSGEKNNDRQPPISNCL